MKVRVLVPARLNSTRFPGKALVSVGQKSHIENLLESIALWFDRTNLFLVTDSRAIDYVAKTAGFNTLMTGEAENGTARIAQAVGQLDLEEDEWILNIQGDLVAVSPKTGADLLETLRLADTHDTPWVTFADSAEWKFGSSQVNSGSVWIEVDGTCHGLMFGRNDPEDKNGVLSNFHSHIGLYAYKPKVLRHYSLLQMTENERQQSLEQFRLLDSGFSPFVGFLDEVPFEINTEEDFVRERSKVREI